MLRRSPPRCAGSHVDAPAGRLGAAGRGYGYTRMATRCGRGGRTCV